MTTRNLVTALYARIKEIRKQAKMRQEDVAAAAHISREAYLRMEKDAANIRMTTFIAVVNALGYEVQLVPTPLADEVAADGQRKAEDRSTQQAKDAEHRYDTPHEVVAMVFEGGKTLAEAWRTYRNLTQAQAAERAGLDLQAYILLESCKTLDKADRILLAKALSVYPVQLDM